MQYNWLDEFCLSKIGTTKDYQEDWEATRYFIGEKMYLMQGGDKDKKPIITVKCEPDFGLFLRNKYDDIVPGYYMNKEHWNSIYIEGNVPDEVVKQMVLMSYELVFKSLTKKKQKEILGE